MYRAYTISDIEFPLSDYTGLVDAEHVKDRLMKIAESVSVDESTCGKVEEIWNHWFPEVKADVFISHSSKDLKRAKSLAAWLKRNFGLDSFVDSEIWGHMDVLLRELDDKYCKFYRHEKAYYDYKKRNGTTAHVHMILSHALTKMIDTTECLMFLETPNSILPTETIKRTYSPWIFHELSMVDCMKQRKPKRKIVQKEASVDFSRMLNYPVSCDRLQGLGSVEFSKWRSEYRSKSSSIHPLDILYRITPTKDT